MPFTTVRAVVLIDATVLRLVYLTTLLGTEPCAAHHAPQPLKAGTYSYGPVVVGVAKGLTNKQDVRVEIKVVLKIKS